MTNLTNLIKNALEQFKDEQGEDGIFGYHKELPVVRDFIKANHLKRDIFEGHNILFIQHCLAPIINRIETMMQHGVNKETKFWFVDIPYSTSLEIKNCIKNRWKQIKFAKEYDFELKPYKQAQQERLITILKEISETPEDLLIVDDGAYTIRTLIDAEKNTDWIKKLLNRKISIVEQTTRGHRLFEKDHQNYQRNIKFLKKHKISLTSIARTKTKTQLESPFIGEAVYFQIKKALEKNNKEFGKTLVIGFGSIGEAVVKNLSKDKLIETLHISEAKKDLYPKIKAIDKEKKITILPKLEKNSLEKFSEYDTIIGCTGKVSFHPDYLPIIANSGFVISTTSGSHEFNRKEFLNRLNPPQKEFEITNLEEMHSEGIHSKITLKKGNKSFSFINRGFPINFQGFTETNSYWSIQATHCLLICASSAAIFMRKQGEYGFTSLDPAMDRCIHKITVKNLEEYLEDVKSKKTK